jgi:hypothetical protein
MAKKKNKILDFFGWYPDTIPGIKTVVSTHVPGVDMTKVIPCQPDMIRECSTKREKRIWVDYD